MRAAAEWRGGDLSLAKIDRPWAPALTLCFRRRCTRPPSPGNCTAGGMCLLWLHDPTVHSIQGESAVSFSDRSGCPSSGGRGRAPSILAMAAPLHSIKGEGGGASEGAAKACRGSRGVAKGRGGFQWGIKGWRGAAHPESHLFLVDSHRRSAAGSVESRDSAGARSPSPSRFVVATAPVVHVGCGRLRPQPLSPPAYPVHRACSPQRVHCARSRPNDRRMDPLPAPFKQQRHEAPLIINAQPSQASAALGRP